jgi:hypothetical protein
VKKLQVSDFLMQTKQDASIPRRVALLLKLSRVEQSGEISYQTPFAVGQHFPKILGGAEIF